MSASVVPPPPTAPTVTPAAPTSAGQPKKFELPEPIKKLLKLINEKIVHSRSFEKLAKKIFAEADIDGSGELDEAELYACVLLIYDHLNARLPTHVPAPTRARVTALMKKYDANRDGTLRYEEFFNVARQLFGVASINSIPANVVVVLVLRLLLLPLVANLFKGLCSSVGGPLYLFAVVPTMVYAVLMEVGGRLWLATSM